MNKYDDIINIDYQGPKNHQRMSRIDRAAQFGAFRALTGYEDELKETRRIVGKKIILSEDKKEELDLKIRNIKDNKIRITYFIKDLKKEGGYYKNIIGYMEKIDYLKKEIILDNKERILIDNILDIDSNLHI